MLTIPIHRAPAPALAVPVASAIDIRAAIQVLTDEADAKDAVGGSRATTQADSLRRAIALLRASLHRAGG